MWAGWQDAVSVPGLVHELSYTLCWLFSASFPHLTCEVHSLSFPLPQWAPGNRSLGCDTPSHFLPSRAMSSQTLALRARPSSMAPAISKLQKHGGNGFPVFLPWPHSVNNLSLHFFRIPSDWVFCCPPRPGRSMDHIPKSFLDVHMEPGFVSLEKDQSTLKWPSTRVGASGRGDGKRSSWGENSNKAQRDGGKIYADDRECLGTFQKENY